MKMVTLTITENGDQLFLNSPGGAVFCEAGLSTVRRASHVEPFAFFPRIIFRGIRACVSDTSKLAAWTRTWSCRWRVDTRPVGGPILRWKDVYYNFPPRHADLIAVFWDRATAIEAEIRFLNKFFMEKNNS